MVQSIAASDEGLESGESSGDVRLPLDVDSDEESGESGAGESSQLRHSPRAMLASSLRAHTARLRIARIRADFEQTVLTILTLNVIYMYYIDHKLLVLVIRACQVIRLLHFPYASQASQRGTAVLLLVSNLPVLLIHKMLFSGPGIRSNIGDMLFINFIGPEPKSLTKILTVDVIIMMLQAMLLQSKWEWEGNFLSLQLVPALPVPTSEGLVNGVPPEETSRITQRQNADENDAGSTSVT